MNKENAKLPQRAAAVEAIREVINLMDDTELVFGLQELGVPKDDLSKISERIFKQRQHECGPPAYVPRRLSSSNIMNLLNDTWTDGVMGNALETSMSLTVVFTNAGEDRSNELASKVLRIQLILYQIDRDVNKTYYIHERSNRVSQRSFTSTSWPVEHRR